ncbi:MAG: hypothetical protein A2W23_07695 [Planctomycetes bacterium RBG_16_43_13]|nr:MAG: hypothetical protein A2W23_07695 [Planctomycetes bacterium RBG_16_43_13]
MVKLKRFIPVLGVLLLLVSLSNSVVVPQDEGFEDEIRKLLEDGMDAYKRGKYEDAYTKLETALQRHPNSTLIYAFIQRVGHDLIASMLNAEDEKLRNTGKRLIELGKAAVPGEWRKELIKRMDEFITGLKSDKQAEVFKATYYLVNAGPWAVKYLLPALGEKKEEIFRTRVVDVLVRMNVDATNALIEALDSPNDFMRQNASIVLGHIKDERAIPALKKLWEDPNEKVEVKKYANESLYKITKKTVDELRSAKEEYFYLAEKYYYGMSSVIPTFQHEYIIWKWDRENDKLTQREVPPFAYNDQMAEEACYDALELDPNYERVWSLLVSIFLNQYIEGRIAIETAERSTMVGDTDASALAGLKKRLAGIERLNVQANMAGKKYIYQALTRAMEDGNAILAKACLNVIKEMGKEIEIPLYDEPERNEDWLGRKYFGYPLIKSLTNDDKRVRYAAVETMVYLNPQHKHLGMELVLPSVIDALGEQAVRVALVIYDVKDDEDRNFINQLRKSLISVNVFPVISRSGGEGIIRAKSYPSVDVIMLQSKISNQVYFAEEATRQPVIETIFDTLKADVRTKNIPIYLICKNDLDRDSVKKIYTDKVDTYMLTTYNKLDLNAAFEKTFNTPEAQKDAKGRANEISAQAANAIAYIRPTDTIYSYRNLIEPLIKTLDPQVLRIDEIRLPCIKALGTFGDVRALDVLARLLDDNSTNKKEIRLACANSISKILRATDMVPPVELFDILKKQLSDGDYEIEIAVGEALGNAKLTNEQRRELEKFKRIKREVEE